MYQIPVPLSHCGNDRRKTGRGAVRVVLLGVSGIAFSWELFMAGALINAIPGIVLQLILIPMIMVALNKAKIVPFKKNEHVRQNV